MGNKAGKGSSEQSSSGQKVIKPKDSFTGDEKAKYMERYGLSEATVKEIKREWDKWSSKGVMSREAFLSHMKSNLMHLDNEFLGRVFKCFDTDNSGNMSFDEYFECRGIILGGSEEIKLEASFRLFDQDGSGELDKDEVIKMLELNTYSLIRNALILKHGAEVAWLIPLELDEEAIAKVKSLADTIFEEADKDKSGTISFEEFKEGYEKNPKIMKFFNQY